MFDQTTVEAFANKVTKEKNRLREALLRRKCSAEGILKDRIVLAKEITLSLDEKKNLMREAFDLVLANMSLEAKAEWKIAIGKVLNRHKQERRFSSKKRLEAAVAEIEKREKVDTSLLEEIALAEQQLRQEEECRLATEILIRSGKAVRDDKGNLIIFVDSLDEE